MVVTGRIHVHKAGGPTLGERGPQAAGEYALGQAPLVRETHITLMAHPYFAAVGHDQTKDEWANLRTKELASVCNRVSDSGLILLIQLVRPIPRRDNVHLHQESIRKFSKMKKPGWNTTPVNHPGSRRYRRYGICNSSREHWQPVY